MLESLVTFLFIFLTMAFFMGGIAFIGYIADEQEHRHKLEIEKAKQGIFDPPSKAEPFYKKFCKQIIFTLIFAIIVIFICYVFNVPSDLAEYILEIVR